MNVGKQILTPKDTDCFSELIKVFEKVFEWENFSPPTNSYFTYSFDEVNDNVE